MAAHKERGDSALIKRARSKKQVNADKWMKYTEMSKCKPSISAQEWMQRPAYGGLTKREVGKMSKEEFVNEWKTKIQETEAEKEGGKPEEKSITGQAEQKPAEAEQEPVKAEFSESLSAEGLKRKVLVALDIPELQLMTVSEVINLFIDKINNGEITTSNKVMINILINK